MDKVEVAYGNRQRVRSIFGPRRMVETKENADHLLNLFLGGTTVISHRVFDLGRLIGVDREIVVNTCQKRSGLRLTDSDRGSAVSRHEGFFDRCFRRLIVGDERDEILIDDFEPLGQRSSARWADGIVVNEGHVPTVGVDDANAHCVCTRIDA